MMAENLLFELISPDGLIKSTKVKELVLVTENGEIGILSKHAPIKTTLKASPIRYIDENNNEEIFAILGGVMEVSNNKISIVTNFAQSSDGIDESKTKQAAEQSELAIKTLAHNDPELVIAKAKLEKELLLLKTAKLRTVRL